MTAVRVPTINSPPAPDTSPSGGATGPQAARSRASRAARQFVRAPLAIADRHQRADHGAHLIVQERTRHRGDVNLAARLRNVEPVERLHRRLGLALGRAERGEVVLAGEPLRRHVHGRDVERTRHPPGAQPVKREIRPPIGNAVEIVTAHRGAARVEILGHALRRDHRDRMRPQVRVDRVAHRVGGVFLRKVEMRNLAERVDAGVGAAGALHGGFLAAERLDRLGQRALHRRRVVLPLPAGERRAVVFDGDLVARHGVRDRRTPWDTIPCPKPARPARASALENADRPSARQSGP